MLQVINKNGRHFNVRLVRKGDDYGLNDCLKHDRIDPMVEFYDATYADEKTFGKRGQFISRYNLSALVDWPNGVGLVLDGGIPEWAIDADALSIALDWAMDEAFDHMIEKNLIEGIKS